MGQRTFSVRLQTRLLCAAEARLRMLKSTDLPQAPEVPRASVLQGQAGAQHGGYARNTNKCHGS
jgi:hypothetical protein